MCGCSSKKKTTDIKDDKRRGGCAVGSGDVANPKYRASPGSRFFGPKSDERKKIPPSAKVGQQGARTSKSLDDRSNVIKRGRNGQRCDCAVQNK